jgi:tRNA G26 N,N-dimethylase Trm1
VAIEGFTCKIKPVSLEKWVQDYLKNGEHPDKNCAPCTIKPLAGFYLGTLEEAKASQQITELKKAWETGDLLTIARALDTIKKEVGDNLKPGLIELDCYAQSGEIQTAET